MDTTQAERRQQLRDQQRVRKEQVAQAIAQGKIDSALEDLVGLREKTTRAEQRLDRAVLAKVAAAKDGIQANTLPMESLDRLGEQLEIIDGGLVRVRKQAPAETEAAE
jgi:hypothetical protein